MREKDLLGEEWARLDRNDVPRPRPKTPHDVAVAYARKGWNGYSDRAGWEEGVLRYHGPQTLPEGYQ